MLTKDLISYRIRTGRIYPQFVDPDCPKLLQAAEQMTAAFAHAVGQSLGELEECCPAASKFELALRKLQLDRCEFEQPGDELLEWRWDLIKEATQLRRSSSNAVLDYRTFCADFEKRTGHNPLAPTRDLFGDLPRFRRVISLHRYSGEELLHRYNCAQIQGLLIHAKHIDLKIGKSSVLERRKLMQMLKFHQLLAEIWNNDKSSQGFRIRIDGPLSVFSKSTAYGLRLANFFPYVPFLSHWELTAEISLKQKNLRMCISHKENIRSHYRSFRGYWPEEYKHFVKEFHKVQNAWKADFSEQVVNLGAKQYASPDFEFKDHNGQRCYLEIFNRWHKHALDERINQLISKGKRDYMIAVDRSLVDGKENHQAFEKAEKSGVSVISFRHFPSARAISKLLLPG